ncbi:MAG: hypothetical protein IJR19_03845 [Lachnospiraceae bacterium]|nr:hypothetical protein [Lachnospiraceae bacterium]HAV00790.1 hypothetical protein [Lachnospiraceae bacterium]
MRQKSGKATIIIGVITLIVIAFILFSTLYDQIIAQNEGFFYMLIFGGILVLVFVLINLITKLIAISPQSTASMGYTILEIVMIVLIGVFFIISRLKYENTLSVEDSLFYRAAVFINDGTLSGSLDVVTKCLDNPVDYAYAVLLSIIFKISDVDPGAVMHVNITLILMTALLAAHISHAVGGRVCAVIAFFASLFIPSQAFAVYSYNSVPLFALTVFICFDLYTQIYLHEDMRTWMRITLDCTLGFFAAVMLITDPVTIIFIILLITHFFIYSDRNLRSFLITLGVFIGVFLIFAALKAGSLGVPVSKVLRHCVSRFNVKENEETGERYELSQVYESFQEEINNQNQNITENYYFLFKKDGTGISAIQASWLQLATNLIYMFSLVLSGSCVIYMFRSRNTRAVVIMLMSTGMLFTAFFKALADANGFYIFEILIVFACAGLAYMYENQHPEAFVEEDIWETEEELDEEEEAYELTEEERAEILRRARALIFIGEDEELYEEIKRDEEEERQRLAAEAEQEKEEGARPERKKRTVSVDEPEEPADDSDTEEEEYYEEDYSEEEYYEDEESDDGEYPDEDEYYEDDAGYDEAMDDEIKGRKPGRGEPLKNPLPTPAEHVGKSLDFDDDVFDEDGYDEDDEEPDGDYEDEDEDW